MMHCSQSKKKQSFKVFICWCDIVLHEALSVLYALHINFGHQSKEGKKIDEDNETCLLNGITILKDIKCYRLSCELESR